MESIGGYTEIISLNEGIPAIENLESYVKIVREKAALRRLIFTGQKLIDQALIAEQSPQELAEQFRQTIEEVEMSGAPEDDGGSTPEEIALSFPGGLDAFLDPSKRAKGLPTGFTQFDDMTSGLHAGEVVIIAARPSQGKTAISLNIAAHLTLTPGLEKSVAFFSLEMSKSSILGRLVCSHARVDSHKQRMGMLNAEERDRLRRSLFAITESHLRIYDQSGITMPEIAKRIRRLAKEEMLHLAIIDYLGLIGSHGRIENRNQEITVMSRQLKMLASELQIPIIVLSQLSRANERRGTPRPMLSDLRDSGSIEQDADIVAFIFREELYRRDREDLKGLADLIVAKQRNGPIGDVKLRFLSHMIRFENRADDLPPEE